MKKAIVIIVLIILLAVVGIIYLFKINKSDNMKIAILESVWWANDDEQKIERKESSKEYEVEKDKTITISVNWHEDITLKIIQVEDEYIEVETSEQLSDIGSVSEGKTRFRIEKDKKTTLKTLTMDAGASYEIEIK